ncbi:GrpB family protein [Lysinibacillus irui]|uniref:GrpB family protein n=1 Tax=Lysinibacillus irui TaxID=2998077 RepID=A0AAJ5UVG4_9BACI|nr:MULTISPECIES: GrpB family protein [Lysinibacillus]MEA0552471.1 GrpB family protein [Lysinibacillus irui]MEA0562847.1 GrpB family protein [Lysinibacillus irui]MEA0978423.1 GrpB family protein [Lysinibacillus irui]MEA1044577.1 GrpB family protein [Lysinibacillus irui]WDV06700.1 GrpB family protein [Lysinibacillus irui]
MRKIKVVLSEYDLNWEEQFLYEKRRIQKVIGHALLGIEHIGSTSIKGLKAKPIIDILLGVKSIEEVPELIEALSNIDYEYVPKLELMDRRFFRKGLWGQGTCHLHVCEYNSKEWNDKCLFRDYLRINPQAAKEYETLKEQLANHFQYDRQTYTKKKGPFIQKIIARAKVEDLL